jgi:mannose-6-phosphate isomerase
MNPVVPFSEPLVFGSIYQERVWGGRELEREFRRALPNGGTYGESWEISDRPGAESRVIRGPSELVGKTLGELWDAEDVELRESIFGVQKTETDHFPLLIKILDARDRLSLQVHPPEAEAASLGGEPKTEMWVVATADPGASLYLGVKPGVSRESFAGALADGTVEGCVQRVPAAAGDFFFIPSGRLHAIGAGLTIFEIQQNSDTTYRVYDWGRPRELHVEESLRCIDFADTVPERGRQRGSLLVDCGHFRVDRHTNSVISLPENRAAIVTVVTGAVRIERKGGPLFRRGDSFLVPALWSGAKRLVADQGEATVLVTTW